MLIQWYSNAVLFSTLNDPFVKLLKHLYAYEILLNKRLSCFNKFVIKKKHDTVLLSIFSRSTANGHCDITGFCYKHQTFFPFHLFRNWKDKVSLEKQI